MKITSFLFGDVIRKAMSAAVRRALAAMSLALLFLGSGCSQMCVIGDEEIVESIIARSAISPEPRDAESVSRFAAWIVDSFTNGTPFAVVEQTHPCFRTVVSNDVVHLDDNGWLAAIGKRGCLVRAYPYEGLIGRFIREEFAGTGELWGINIVVIPDESRLVEGRSVAACSLCFNVLVPRSGEPCLVGGLLGGPLGGPFGRPLCEEYMVRYLKRTMQGELTKYTMTYITTNLSDNPFAWRIANDIQKRINDKDCVDFPAGLKFADDCVREKYLRLVSSLSDSGVVVLPYLRTDISEGGEGTCIYEFCVEPKSLKACTGSLNRGQSLVVGVDNNDWIVFRLD